MKASRTLTSDVRYVIDLVQAGLDGIDSARKGAGLPLVSMNPVWAPPPSARLSGRLPRL